MPRPKFPIPYVVLPASSISRIVSNQAHYDKDPEAAERRQAEEEEEEEEREYENNCRY